MRLVKGCKVEILVNTKELGVEWHGACIISGNGHTYKVEYEYSSVTGEARPERVPRKFIRPCPPIVENTGSWKTNDIVEVWNAGSGKEATVLNYMTEEFYFVRLHGSFAELKVHKVHVRMRQSWKNGQWIISRTGPAKSRVVKISRNSISNNYQITPVVHQAENVRSPGLDASCLHVPSPSTLKRVFSHCSSRVEDYSRKKRAAVIMGDSKRFKAVSTAPLLEKVDAIAYPHNNLGEKYTHYSLTNSINHLYEKRKENPCNFISVEEPGCSCSNMSSVGSCSVISGSANEFFSDTLAGPCHDYEDTLDSGAEFLNAEDVNEFNGDMSPYPCQSDEDTICSDAESIDVEDVDKGCTILSNEVVAERIHRLELNAYYCTLDAMYASGPLSWEKEELLTNLRTSLNVSNDEHLTGIRNLVSAGQNF